ncbi:hypothetical protein [Bacillus cereus]|uniref:hypothetical protein n=1 Tax=Bacillus cereus TaxID=1396 RepID=UPI00124CB856|nr:hypothetical protein [Bacillus cereus]KAB2399196.1 hypothetical protein F8171_03630 [Bacillus cereus]
MSNDKKTIPSDSCLIGLSVALSDSKVIKAINKKIERQYIFCGYECKDGIGIPELIRIHLNFDCNPKKPCPKDPSLYVTINFIDKYVQHIDGENT